jgi:tRNA G18 (ribose-2'-O)-methylase SpoU
MDCTADTGSKEEVDRYLVIANVSKKNNVKFLINAAAAYKFQVILVGCKKMDDLHVAPELTFVYMDTLDQAVAFLAEKSIPLVGIEIMDGAKSVVDNPFSQSIAFMPGNEGTGMSNHQKEVCSSFVYIPQYGSGTASLNVYVATTLIMHRFNLWANSTPC